MNVPSSRRWSGPAARIGSVPSGAAERLVGAVAVGGASGRRSALAGVAAPGGVVLSRAVEAADQVLKTHERHVLSTADWEAFCKALDRPPKPNRALKEGFRWYRTKTA